MSRIAFLTRVFVFSQRAAAEPVDRRPGALGARVLLDPVEGLDGHLELVARLVAEDHELARGPAHLERLEAQEAADPVLLVDDEVARLEVAEVREEAAQPPAAAAARVQVDLLGEHVAVGEHRERGLGQLEAARQGADARRDARALADGEPVLAQQVGEAIGAPGVAEEDDGRAGRGAEVLAEPDEVARVERAPGDRRRGAESPSVATSRTSTTGACARRSASAAGVTRASAGLGCQAVRAARLVLERARPEALGLLAHELGLDHDHGARRQVGPGGLGRAGHERHQVGQDLGLESAIEGVDEVRELAPAREAPLEDRPQRLQHRACREDVGERERHERLDRAARALRLGVEAPQALDACRRRTRPAPAPRGPTGRRRGSRRGGPSARAP